MELTPLRRANSGAMLGGVCAALARRWKVDPTIVRIAMVLLALMGGLGIAFYVGALLLVPREGSTEVPLNRIAPFTRRWSPAGTIAAVVGLGLLITIAVGSWLPFGIAPAVGLGFLWYFGFYRRRRRFTPGQPSADDPTGSTPPDAAQPPALAPTRPVESMTPFERAAADWQQRVAEERQKAPPAAASWGNESAPSTGSAADTAAEATDVPRLVEYRPANPAAHWPELPATSGSAPPPVPSWTPPTRRRRPRAGWLWPLVLCLTGAGLATLAVLHNAFGLAVPAVAYAGTVLGALGLGLFIGAFAGRPGGLLPLGVLTGLVTVAMLLPGPGLGPMGDQTYSYTSTAQLPATKQSHGAGDVIIDLRQLAVTDTRRVEFDNLLGDVAVKLPAAGNVVVQWKVGLGDYAGPDGRHEGVDANGTYQRVTDPAAPTLTVVVQVTAGDLTVVTP